MSLNLANPDFYLYGIAALHLGVAWLLASLLKAVRSSWALAVTYAGCLAGVAWRGMDFYKHLPALWWPQTSLHVEEALLDSLGFLLLALTVASACEVRHWWMSRPKKAPRG